MDAVVKVFLDAGILLRPSVLMGSVEQSVLCLPHVGVCASRAGVLVDYVGGAEEWCPILVGCIERHLRCLEKHLEDDVLLLLHQLGQPFRGLLDYRFSMVANVR